MSSTLIQFCKNAKQETDRFQQKFSQRQEELTVRLRDVCCEPMDMAGEAYMIKCLLLQQKRTIDTLLTEMTERQLCHPDAYQTAIELKQTFDGEDVELLSVISTTAKEISVLNSQEENKFVPPVSKIEAAQTETPLETEIVCRKRVRKNSRPLTKRRKVQTNGRMLTRSRRITRQADDIDVSLTDINLFVPPVVPTASTDSIVRSPLPSVTRNKVTAISQDGDDVNSTDVVVHEDDEHVHCTAQSKLHKSKAAARQTRERRKPPHPVFAGANTITAAARNDVRMGVVDEDGGGSDAKMDVAVEGGKDGAASDVDMEVSVEGDSTEDDSDDDEVPAKRKARYKGGREGRMDELRRAMGVRKLKLRRKHDYDDANDHPWDQCSPGVVVSVADDEYSTAIVSVNANCERLCLGPRSRMKAANTANVTASGARNKSYKENMKHMYVGTATHRFAKSAVEYFTGGRTAPPNAFRYKAKFRRPTVQPLAARFAAIPRPYRDGFIEAIIHFWPQYSAMTDVQFFAALKRAINGGWGGPAHSVDTFKKNKKMKEGQAQ